MPQRFKKVIADFSGGMVTITSPRDLSPNQFQEIKNIRNDIMGRIEASYAKKAVSETANTSADPKIDSANSGTALINLRSEYTIADSPAETPSLYWIVVARAQSSNWEIFFQLQSDGTGGAWASLDSLATIDAGGLDWGTTSTLQPDIYTVNGDIRIGEKTFAKSPLWVGHIKRDMFGQGLDNQTAPNYSNNKLEYNDWSSQAHHLAPPTIVKMDACHDLTGKVLNAGEVGVYVHDPLKYRGLAGNHYEEIAFPLTINETTGAFKTGDRYACTFEYDGTTESELSRNAKGEIGISGFPVVETQERDIEIATYPDSTGDDVDITVIDVTHPENRSEQAGNYALSIIWMKAESATYGPHKVLSPGDYVKINSEVMLVTHLDVDGSGFSTNKVPIYVHRGVNETKPLDDTDLEGEYVYRYPTQQRARAINVVLNKGIKTQPLQQIFEQAFFTSDGALDSLVVYTNESLGSNGNRLNLSLSSTSDGTLGVTITKAITHPLSNAGSAGGAVVDIQISVTNSVSVDVTKQDLVNLLNNGVNSSGYIAGSSNDIPVTNDWKINLPDYFSATTTGTAGRLVAASQTLDFTNFAGGDDAPTLNPRISAVNLYWQPEGEPDWFLVDKYDIDKGITGSQFAKKDSYPQGFDRRFFGSDGMHIGSDFGAWIDCPHWHYNSHNSSGLVTIPFAASNGVLNCGMGLVRASTSSGGVSNNPWKDRAAIKDIALLAPVAAASIGDSEGENSEFTKKIGKFNQLRTNYVPIQSIMTDNDTDTLHNLGWGMSSGEAFDGGASSQDTLTKQWDSGNYRLYLGSFDSTDFNKYGWVPGNYIVLSRRSGTPADTTDGEYFLNESSPTFSYTGANQLGNAKTSPYGIFKISANTSNYLTIDNAATPVPTGWATTDNFRADAYPGFDMTNHFGASMYDNIRATLTDASMNITAGENVGMEFVRGIPRGEVSTGYAGSAAVSPVLSGYEMVSAFPRKDALSTFYRPFIGERLFTYQSLTGRTGTTRIQPVKWRASVVSGTIAVIGNVDTVDDNSQTIREASRIMWTLPNRYDDFCILRSKEIFSIDGGIIKNLVTMGNLLYVIKDMNAYALDMSKNFSVVQQFVGFGSPFDSECYAKTPIGLVIVNEQGIYQLPNMEELSYPIRDTWQGIGSDLLNPVVGYHPERNEIIVISNSQSTDSGNAKAFIYNLTNKSWKTENIFYIGATNDDNRFSTNFIVQNRRLQLGIYDDAGTDDFAVYEVYGDTGGYSNIAEGLVLWTKDFMFGAPGRTKSVTDLIITYAGTIVVDFYIDGNTTTAYKTMTLVDHASTKNRRYKVNVECKSLSLKFTASDGDFLIEDIILEGYVTDKF